MQCRRNDKYLAIMVPCHLVSIWVDWKCRTWKWQTIKIAGHENAGHEIDGPMCGAWNCRTWKWRTKYVGHVKVRPLSTVEYTSVASVFHCRRWSSDTRKSSSRFTTVEVRQSANLSVHHSVCPQWLLVIRLQHQQTAADYVVFGRHACMRSNAKSTQSILFKRLKKIPLLG